MQTFFSIWCILCVLMTVMPFFPSEHYLVRGWDFPILQIAVITLVGAVGLLFYYNNFVNWQRGLLLVTLVALVYQGAIIYPYSFLAMPQVKMAKEFEVKRSIKILSSNVLIDNRDTGQLKKLIGEKDPDIILLLEPNEWWATQMSYLELEKGYTQSVKIPLDNAYGLLLYSRLPLEESMIHYLIEPDVPSVFTTVVLPSGEKIKLYCVHPKPPSPTENKKSTERDAELLLVAKINKKEELPSIVVGDLNDVAWSHTTRMFQKISELLDPRIGRRPYATYNANYPIFAWPLDHVFHSEDFELVEIQRLPHIGSDHFPIFIQLTLTDNASKHHIKPKADGEEEAEAIEKIQEGIEKGRE